MSSESGAIAAFSVYDTSGNSYASIFQVSSSQNYITGQAKLEMPANTEFIVRIGGIRNPRFLIDNSALPESTKQQFIIKTYDQNSATLSDSTNLIDYGKGAPIDISVASPLETFSIETFNDTNGADTTF